MWSLHFVLLLHTVNVLSIHCQYTVNTSSIYRQYTVNTLLHIVSHCCALSHAAVYCLTLLRTVLHCCTLSHAAANSPRHISSAAALISYSTTSYKPTKLV